MVTAPAETVPPDPAAAVDLLAAARRPYLIGVRHHSPALSVVLDRLLDAAAPEVVLIELPAEAQPWLRWLTDPRTVAPVALAGAVPDGPLALYPFADFSPELVALRWAHRNGVEVLACDLSLADRRWAEPDDRAVPPAALGPATAATTFGSALAAAAGSSGGGSGPASSEDVWDRLVEAPAPGSTAESVRRTGLAVGWALRSDAASGPGVAPLDLAREAEMRRVLAAATAGGRRAAAVVGAFHAPALLAAGPEAVPAGSRPKARGTSPEPVMSLVPYDTALLDARSGYAAGIRDPAWQSAVVRAAGDVDRLRSLAPEFATALCAGLRAEGHPAGPAEAREIARLARDLASLRTLPAPGRRELVEALGTVLAQGDTLGRGRAVARAAQPVLVGSVRGRLPAEVPRSGLAPAVEAELAELRLPGPDTVGEQPTDLRLDPLRSPLDRRRHLMLTRMTVAGISYAAQAAVSGVGAAGAVTTRWQVQWSVATPATIEAVALRGVTLVQAAEGVLGARLARQRAEGGPTVPEVLAGLRDALDAGLPVARAELLRQTGEVVAAQGRLPELLAGIDLLAAVLHGQVPATAPEDVGIAQLERLREELLDAAVREVDGLAGSTDLADAHALAALVRTDERVPIRLAAALRRLAETAGPLLQGAATGVLFGLAGAGTDGDGGAALAIRVGSWIDLAETPDDRRQLRARLAGLLATAGSFLEADAPLLATLAERIEGLGDTPFLRRLPALRGGFDALSTADRGRLLTVLADRVDERALDLTIDVDPTEMVAWAQADQVAWDALSTLDEALVATDEPADSGFRSAAVGADTGRTAQRWRLVLGRERERLDAAGRGLARSLDELYGATGHGEGSLAGGTSGGTERPHPGVREWAEELSALFGDDIRDEVLADAVDAGRTDAVFELDPDRVRPSVELLGTVLSLAGGLPEARLGMLRRLVARLVDELSRVLARQLAPALGGLAIPRPTRRPTGRLDLARTIRANLASTYRDDDGTLVVVPERPVFRTLARRTASWHVIVVVDVSGSMETSTVYSALVAAVLAGVPTLRVSFVTFSTEVLDLSEHVSDPLGLLLEVQVGGGTSIALGLAHARTLVEVPSRTLLVLVTDFEEGGPVGPLLGQVRALASAGVSLLGCAALDDSGSARYSVGVAGQVAAAGMPVAAVSPSQLARWVADRVRA